MFKSETLIPEYANLIGWRQHHDANELQIAEELTTTETGEYYQQKHPALQLDIIQALIPANLDLNKYLRDTVTDSTNEIFNDLLQYRNVNQYGKTLLEQSTLLNRFGWRNDKIVNQNRFVGFQVRVKAITGLQVLINEIGLQFDGQEEFKLYLFHTSKTEAIKEIDVTTDGNGSWNWKREELELNGFLTEQFHGGVFILGYYQEDVVSSAINYSNFDWDKGECGTCNNSYFAQWKAIRKHFHIYPIYVPNGSFTKGEMFDLERAVYVNNESYGLNLKMTVRCDLTSFFQMNKFVFKNLLATKVVHKVLQMMKFSQQINHIEENIKMMIIRDLEGDIDTKLLNIPTLYHKEMKSVSFNLEGINGVCLGCKEEGFAPNYGVV